MISELAKLCEQHGLSVNIEYTANEEAWDIDIDNGKENIYNSVIYKGSLVVLLQNAYNATFEYLKRNERLHTM